jgi:protein phosphatase 1L
LLIVATPLPLLAMFVLAPCDVIAAGRDAKERWQADKCHSQNQKNKVAWVVKKRSSRLVIPVTDDADEVAVGWGLTGTLKEVTNVKVEGEGFCLASKAGPRHVMEVLENVLYYRYMGTGQPPV